MNALISLRVFVNDYTCCCERALDIWGYLPFLSTTGGLLRLKLAIVELIIATSASIFHIIAQLYQRGFKVTGASRFQLLEELAHERFENGLKNLLRGSVEMLPLVNLSLIVYDYIKTEGLLLDFKNSPLLSHKTMHMPLICRIFPIDSLYK